MEASGPDRGAIADKKAVAFFGRHASRGSMGLTYQTELCERVHFVAHRGRADLQTEILDQRFRRDRLSRTRMLVHDQREDDFLSRSQFNHFSQLALSTREC